MDGLEVEEEEKSCGTHHIHVSRAGWLFPCLPACPAHEKGKRPAERFDRRTGPKHFPMFKFPLLFFTLP